MIEINDGSIYTFFETSSQMYHFFGFTNVCKAYNMFSKLIFQQVFGNEWFLNKFVFKLIPSLSWTTALFQ